MYRTLSGSSTFEIEIEHSRFIANAFYVSSETDAKAQIQQIKKEQHKATHNCYAYCIDANNYKSNDDGEPSSSAGMPILEIIKSRQLTHCLVVVTRYFGGVKLGVGGLIRAYQGAAQGALDKAKIIQVEELPHYEFATDYALNDIVMHFLKSHKVGLVKHEFDVKVKFEIYVADKNLISELNDYLQGKVEIKYIGDKEITTEV